MVAYEFYWLNEKEKPHFLGILPERRKNPERISSESIINWGRSVIGHREDIKEIFFVKIEL